MLPVRPQPNDHQRRVPGTLCNRVAEPRISILTQVEREGLERQIKEGTRAGSVKAITELILVGRLASACAGAHRIT